MGEETLTMSGNRGRKTISVLHATLGLSLAGFSATWAQEDSAEARRACTPDVFRLCSEFVPDADRIAICLQQQKKYLSVACRKVMAGQPDPR
ncbi:MAG TPA: hypothetical protein VGC26_06930 [Afipia sp.]